MERRLLTEDFVAVARAPNAGERWIADTKVRGFGLRLWATSSGGSKSFAIRVKTHEGKFVRKTFDTATAWHTNFLFRYGEVKNTKGLGHYLEEARAWAADELDGERGRLTSSQLHWIEHRIVGDKVKRLTLEKAARSLLQGMKASSRSQQYIDRIDKLFSNNISSKLKKMPLHKLSPTATARCLVNPKKSAGNIRILRSFIAQVFERGASFHGPLGRFPKELSEEFREQWDKKYDVRYPELRKFKKSKYEEIFTSLEQEYELRTAALCIRLFFEFGAPLQRVMKGRWSQIEGRHWYPYFPDEKAPWFESRESLNENATRLLASCKNMADKQFGTSDYWFPTGNGDPISSVEYLWRKTLKRCRVRHYPLREFARSYRHPTCPSYYLSFLRQYGESFRAIENAAELSKTLLRRK